jgi:hypothetical protein
MLPARDQEVQLMPEAWERLRLLRQFYDGDEGDDCEEGKEKFDSVGYPVQRKRIGQRYRRIRQ